MSHKALEYDINVVYRLIMAKRTDPKAAVKELVNQVGKLEAQRMLIAANVSPSASYKLTNSNYPSVVGALMGAAIMRAIAASEKGPKTA